MRTICLALSALALTLAPAIAAEPAEPPISNPSSLVDNANAEQMAEMLRELGAQQVEVREAEGSKVVGFMDGNIPYNVGFGLCEVRPGKCLAMTMLVIVNMGTAEAPPLETLNNANGGMFVTAVKLDGNRFAVGRVLLVDGGVTKKNVAINLGSFVLTFNALMKNLSNQVVASAPPRSTYLSAPRRELPRPVYAHPAEIAHISKMLSTQYATTLSRGRR